MNILVTGSEGAIGTFIVEQLYCDYPDAKIIRVGRNLHQNQDGRSHYYWGDLADDALLTTIMAENNISHVIVCAAKWNGMNRDPQVLTGNIDITSKLLCHLTDEVEKLVFISSSAVYQDVPQTEDTPIPQEQRSSYGSSKLLGEQMVQRFADISGFSYTIYRPFHIVSPQERFNWGSSHVTTDMCYRMLENKEYIDLNALRNDNGTGFMWVGDMARIVSGNLTRTETHNEVFNIGTPEVHSVRELANEVIKVAHQHGLIERKPEEVPCEVKRVLDDQRFKKMFSTCVDFPLTSFTECISLFIRHKYLKE